MSACTLHMRAAAVEGERSHMCTVCGEGEHCCPGYYHKLYTHDSSLQCSRCLCAVGTGKVIDTFC